MTLPLHTQKTCSSQHNYHVRLEARSPGFMHSHGLQSALLRALHSTPVILAYELLEEGIGVANARCTNQRGVGGEAIAPVGADAALGGALNRKQRICSAAPQSM